MPKAFDHTVDVPESGILTSALRQQIGGLVALYAGGPLRIRLGRPARSTRANAYMWAGVYEPLAQAAREAGYDITAEDLHRHFKQKYLPPIPSVDAFGEEIIKEPSTTKLDSTEFFYYVENVRLDPFVAQLGVIIEDPEDNYRSYSIAEPS